MAESNQFIKVNQLRPGTSGLNLIVKVLDTKMIKGGAEGSSQARQLQLAESLVGDETAMIVFTARYEQVELMKKDATLILHNAKVDLFKGSMRLVVGKQGRIEVASEPAEFNVNQSNNLSLIEFEVITVALN